MVTNNDFLFYFFEKASFITVEKPGHNKTKQARGETEHYHNTEKTIQKAKGTNKAKNTNRWGTKLNQKQKAKTTAARESTAPKTEAEPSLRTKISMIFFIQINSTIHIVWMEEHKLQVFMVLQQKRHEATTHKDQNSSLRSSYSVQEPH